MLREVSVHLPQGSEHHEALPGLAHGYRYVKLQTGYIAPCRILSVINLFNFAVCSTP